MKSIRLSEKLQKELKTLSELENKSESDVIREALTTYIVSKKQTRSSYDLGKRFFDSSDDFDPELTGTHNLSETYKSVLKEKLHAKTHR